MARTAAALRDNRDAWAGWYPDRPASVHPIVWEHAVPLNMEARIGMLDVQRVVGEFLLEHAGGQRNVKPAPLARTIGWFRDGRFLDYTGGNILLDTNGLTRGGQHRLSASIATNTPFKHFFRWNLTEDEIKAENEGGVPWSSAELALLDTRQLGLTDAFARAATAKMLLAIDHVEGFVGPHNAWSDKVLVSNRMADPRVIQATAAGEEVYKGTNQKINKTATSALYAMVVQSGLGDPDEFFTKLKTGLGMEAGDPAHALRESLINGVLSEESNATRILFVMIKQWNLHVAGKSSGKVQRYQGSKDSKRPSKPVKVVGWTPFFG